MNSLRGNYVNGIKIIVVSTLILTQLSSSSSQKYVIVLELSNSYLARASSDSLSKAFL